MQTENGGLIVRLHEDENDAEPLEFYTSSKDVYCAAVLLKTDLDLRREEDIIQLGDLMDAHL